MKRAILITESLPLIDEEKRLLSKYADVIVADTCDEGKLPKNVVNKDVLKSIERKS